MTAAIKVNIASDEVSAVGQFDATDRGFLMPRMTTTQRDAIASPANGLEIFNTTTNVKNIYQSGAWVAQGGSSGSAPSDATYITQTASSGLSAEQALASLSTGLMKVTTTTGVVSSVAAPSGAVVGTSDTQSLTNKKLGSLTTNGYVKTSSGDGTLSVAPTITVSSMLGMIGSSGTVGATFTRFGSFYGQVVTGTTETNQRQTITYACTGRNLYVRTNTAQPALGSLVVTILLNGGATTLTLTIAAGSAAGSFSDLAHSFSIAAGDTLSIQLTNNDTVSVAAAVVSINMQLDQAV